MNKQQEALRLALEALEIGHEYAVETAEHFHIEMAGYKQHRHDAMDAEVKQIADAITAILEALADHTEQPLEMVAEPEEKYRYGTPLLDAMTGNAEQPAPPPECQTEAEKTAFAFGWWKALEMHRTPAQQQEPKPKFVRNVDGVPCITLVEHEHLMRSRPQPAQQQEPKLPEFYARFEDGLVSVYQRREDATPLLLLRENLPDKQPAQPSKPLTDEQIENLWQNTSPYYDHQDFARAIEAAHGITGETK